MNERLQKFARQAGFGSDKNGEIYTSALEHLPITEDLETFARLAQRDALETVRDTLFEKGSANWHLLDAIIAGFK